MTTITEQERAALRREWVDLGRMVLADDPDPADHPAIYAWVLDVIDRGIDDPDYQSIHTLIDHSVNFDIPFNATQGVRDKLIGVARATLAESRGRPRP